MAWQSSGNILGTILYWSYNATEGGMTRNSNSPSTNASLWYTSTSRTFSPNKNYQFITSTDDFRRLSSYTYSKFLEIQSPWGSTFSYVENANSYLDSRSFLSSNDMIFFSKPSTETTSTDMVRYNSTYNGFGNPGSDADGIPVISNFKLVELDWFIQGWALTPNSTQNHGWSYFDSLNKFEWRASSISGTTDRAPVGLNGITRGFTASNHIYRYVSYPSFNVSFDVSVGSGTQSYLDVYLVNNMNPLNTTVTSTFQSALQDTNNVQLLGRILETGNYSFYDLVGDRYIVFNAHYREDAVWSEIVSISNISFDGAYQETDNNEQFLFTDSGTYSDPTTLDIIGGSSDATYSVVVVNEDTLHEQSGTPSNTFVGATGFPGFFSNLYGEVINLNYLNAKVGNGTFKAGVWENGVWNSGWRVDTEVYEFDDVEVSLLMETTNKKWRIQIKGPQTSTSNFNVGDKVSIGNIVGIDINENRKLMKNYFTVLSVSNTNIIVDFNNTFPLRRIEKDSENHKIKITKNVWLNGGFLNGYFEGIWNNGLFKGFPFITEMYNTHWVDGKFDGGHFYGEYPEFNFVDTYYISGSQYTLGLTFGSTAHGFEIGDLVSIDKDNKLLNPQYDGDATVVDVIDDYLILIDKNFGESSTLEGGVISRRTGSAVIQNFNFYDNNVATQTIQDTSNLEAVYKYNSWIDVKWLEESATNLGRSQIIYSNTYGEYSQNNLYGHITEDVLDSVSYFRNSYSLNKTIYSLGTKYKLYEDFLGEISEFNEPFGTSALFGGLDNFFNNGWTYSLNFMTASELQLTRINNTEALEVKITDSNFGIFGLENTNVDIIKSRYSIIEFDLLSFESTVDEVGGLPSVYLLNTINIPSSLPVAPAFPDQEFVYHTRTSNTKKYEYFYNRRGLDLLLLNSDGLTASFDNIKIYETDKVPFFKYTSYDYVNKSVQVPYQGIAPFIDYNDNDFSFIENIDIGLDSLSTTQGSNTQQGGDSSPGSGGIFESI